MAGWENKRAPNGRPLSTLARSFSDTLDNLFLMSPEIESLSQSVAQRKEAVSSQQSELEQLETRIRETEARLQERAVAAGVTVSQDENGSAQSKSSSKRGGVDGVLTAPTTESDKQPSGARRPQTGHGRKQSTSSGAKKK